MNTDIAIIGGGIIGSVISKEIQKKFPNASISLFEKKMIGLGASFYSAGVHFPKGHNQHVKYMSQYSHKYYQNLALEGFPIYPISMELIVQKTRREVSLGRYHTLARLSYSDKSNNSYINLMKLTDHEIYQGQGCHYADVFSLTNMLVRDLRSLVDIYEGTEICHIKKLNNGYQLELSSGGKIQAKKVILAPGAWVNEPAWRDYTQDLGIHIKKIVALHINEQPKKNDFLTVFEEEDAFLLPCQNRGHWLFSYTCNDWDVLPDQPMTLQPKDIEEAKAVLSKYASPLANKINNGRVFCDAYTPNRQPIITAIDKNFIFAGGGNGSGYRLAPAIASEVLKLL